MDAHDLVGPEWKVTSIGGEVLLLDEDAGERTPFLTFDAEGKVAGSSGVNRVMGGYELDGDELRLPALASTRMAGPPAAMAVESRFLAALGTGGPVRLDGDELTIGAVTFTRSSTWPIGSIDAID
jgi:heat shock protein HslJ